MSYAVYAKVGDTKLNDYWTKSSACLTAHNTVRYTVENSDDSIKVRTDVTNNNSSTYRCYGRVYFDKKWLFGTNVVADSGRVYGSSKSTAASTTFDGWTSMSSWKDKYTPRSSIFLW